MLAALRRRDTPDQPATIQAPMMRPAPGLTTMTTLQELLAQQAALEHQIANLRADGRSRAIAEIQGLMTAHGLTAVDIDGTAIPARRGSALAGVKVAPKYRDPATGATWTGRGMKPRWLAAAIDGGKSLADFAV